MKIRPTQIVGLIAIVVFGGGMVWRLTQPSEREIMEQRLASLPRITVPEPTFPPLDLSTPTIPPMPDLSTPSATPAAPMSYDDPKYFNVGSQAAQDDLYCSGVIGAEFELNKNQHPDEMSKQLAAHLALDEAGKAKLIAEKVTTESESAGYSLAYWERGKKDYQAKTLRIPFATCMARAAALPKPN